MISSWDPKEVRILVVDDEASLIRALKRAMERAGYNCLSARDVPEAMELLGQVKVDVVITDIIMPGPSGIELTQLVKKHHSSDVIVMTGVVDNMTYEEVIDKGASDFIQKPVSVKELLARIERVLRERTTLARRYQAEAELKESLDRLQRVMEQTVRSLVSVFEKRDPYTAGHQQRVARLACAMAKEMGLKEDVTDGIRMAGLLHDIGKISVPIDILNKPGRLSDIEFNLIKEHSRVGYEIVSDIEFERPVAQIILQHHERMNGVGYPQGLAGEDILLEARVLAVADVVEAMASHRPYRPALGIDKALGEISQNRGRFYDEAAVDSCLRVFGERGFSLE